MRDEESVLTLPADVTETHPLIGAAGNGHMDRIQANGFIAAERPLLGQVAIATVLVGSAAALSSAGIAVPVDHVGFAKGWDERVPAAPQLAPRSAMVMAPASPRLAVAPLPEPKLDLSRALTARAAVSVPLSPVAPAELSKISPTRIELAPVPRMSLASTTRIVSTPILAEVPVAPNATAIPALAVPPAPVAAPSAAPAGLAVPAAVSLPEAAPLGEAVKLAPTEPPLRLINPPELRGFDLAKLSSPGKSVPAGFAQPATKSALTGKIEGLGKRDTVVGDAVYHQVSVIVAGSEGASVDVRIGADMKPSIKVGDLLALVSDRMDPDSAARFAAAASAGDYVSLATLRAAGFDVAYNAGTDSISISASQ
jgi:hypothetical protein